jgi:hypothetical protein
MPRQVHSGVLSPKNLSRILTSCIIFLKNAFLLFKSVSLSPCRPLFQGGAFASGRPRHTKSLPVLGRLFLMF